MLVFEFETRLVVIEISDFPVLFRVTRFALLAQPALMNIVLTVAIIAPCRCIAKLLPGQMAGYALLLRFLVRLFQRKLGATVIELALVKLDDLCFAPFVLSVADTTLGVGNTAMVVLKVTYVASDFLVAIQAKLGLRGLVETLVALGTFRSPLGMTGN
jgi:hypothetical protein